VLDARQDVGQRAHVGRLFLHPDDFARVRMARNFRAQLVFRKGIELVEKQDGRIGIAALFAFGAQFVADFSAADQDSLADATSRSGTTHSNRGR
jgi:hypothetical protein